VLVSISATHKNTSFETLEKLSASNAGLSRSLADAHDTIRGVVIVSTCNRFEAYFDLVEEDDWASPVPAVGGAIDQLAKHAGLGAREMRDSVEFAHGTAVAQHLFSVASALDRDITGRRNRELRPGATFSASNGGVTGSEKRCAGFASGTLDRSTCASTGIQPSL